MYLTSRQKAQAAEALIRHPDLSPAARRVGLELLNYADRRSGISWPSEARMAEALGVDARTVRRGKAALRAAGLLSWKRRGPHKTPIYKLAWERLVQLAAAIKSRVSRACQAARKARQDVRVEAAPAFSKPRENSAAFGVDRTFSSAYSTHQGFKGALEGKTRNHRAQTLSDEQLVAKASARFWTALQSLGPQIVAEFISNPRADELQDAAIRAERFKPDQGRSGVMRLRELLQAHPA